jgi:hypothetical protein
MIHHCMSKREMRSDLAHAGRDGLQFGEIRLLLSTKDSALSK